MIEYGAINTSVTHTRSLGRPSRASKSRGSTKKTRICKASCGCSSNQEHPKTRQGALGVLPPSSTRETSQKRGMRGRHRAKATSGYVPPDCDIHCVARARPRCHQVNHNKNNPLLRGRARATIAVTYIVPMYHPRDETAQNDIHAPPRRLSPCHNDFARSRDTKPA